MKCNHSRKWGTQIMRQVLSYFTRRFFIESTNEYIILLLCLISFRIGWKKKRLDMSSPSYQTSVNIGCNIMSHLFTLWKSKYNSLSYLCRYKIYAEGYAWSVSLKYIISCGSLTLIISPQYDDFFSRSLMPVETFWPVSAVNMCPSIKFAVDWGNANPSEVPSNLGLLFRSVFTVSNFQFLVKIQK